LVPVTIKTCNKYCTHATFTECERFCVTDEYDKEGNATNSCTASLSTGPSLGLVDHCEHCARSESACGCHSHRTPGHRVHCSSKRTGYSPTPYGKLCNSTLTFAANLSDLTPLCSDETDWSSLLSIPIFLAIIWWRLSCRRRRAEQATHTAISTNDRYETELTAIPEFT